MDEADYIIVGAGSAGCVLAARLTEDADTRVRVLEAGGEDRHWLLHVPLGYGKVWRDPAFNWSYLSEPEPHLDGRQIFHPRGRVLGGSSSINVMAYVRGHRNDFDRWPQLGMAGWSYTDVLPYFKKSESFADGSNAYRGGDGPLGTRKNTLEDPVFDAFVAAGCELGHKVIDDYNGAEQEGFSRLQHTIKNGRRCSAAGAYLHPARLRHNLQVVTRALATKILIEGNRAVGVQYLQDGQLRQARAAREVLLAGGAINSPQLLMLSGIGPADALKEQGITVRIPLSGVGQNLWDHPLVYTEYANAVPSTFQRRLRLDRLTLASLQAYLFGTGYATHLPATGTAFLRSRSDQLIPDLQLYCRSGVLASHEWFPGIQAAGPDGFSLLFCHLRPESRGSVRLHASDPAVPVQIVNNFLSTDSDRRAMRAGVKLLSALARRAPITKLVGAPLNPPGDLRNDSEIDAFVARGMSTIYHPAGTCRFGTNEDAVVDPAFQVRGVERLRVIDASVLPEPIGGNLNAPVIMLAERASDSVRGRAFLPPAHV